VKHGYVACPSEWPYSSFHRWVRAGVYPPDWACTNRHPQPMTFSDIQASVGESLWDVRQSLTDCTGQPLIYSKTNDGYRLYSVGVNQKDDQSRSYDEGGDDLVVTIESADEGLRCICSFGASFSAVFGQH
jgi:hypothetical protein